jgi:endonuclease YncB( thermonuclease family)
MPFRVTPVLLMLLTLTTLAFANDLNGEAYVTDGDSLELHRTTIRLNGIDAPESDQLCRDEESELYPCGRIATNALFDFIAKRSVDCVDLDERSWKRTIAVCSVGGTDIADWMVRNGYALDWPKYSKGGYAEPQAEAKREKRGMWSGTFVEPWKYRACRHAGRTITACSDGDFNARR